MGTYLEWNAMNIKIFRSANSEYVRIQSGDWGGEIWNDSSIHVYWVHNLKEIGSISIGTINSLSF